MALSDYGIYPNKRQAAFLDVADKYYKAEIHRKPMRTVNGYKIVKSWQVSPKGLLIKESILYDVCDVDSHGNISRFPLKSFFTQAEANEWADMNARIMVA